MTQTSILSRPISPKWLRPESLFPGGSQFPPAPSGGSPRPAGGSDPVSFQMTAGALGLRVWEILCVPFKNEVSVSYRPPVLPYTSPAGLYSGGSSSWRRTPRLGNLMWSLDNSFLGEDSEIEIFLLFVGRLPRSVGSHSTASPPLLRGSLWFLP